jgi:hypothetical protein
MNLLTLFLATAITSQSANYTGARCISQQTHCTLQS